MCLGMLRFNTQQLVRVCSKGFIQFAQFLRYNAKVVLRLRPGRIQKNRFSQ